MNFNFHVFDKNWKMIRQIEVDSPVLGEEFKQIHKLIMKIISFYCADKMFFTK